MERPRSIENYVSTNSRGALTRYNNYTVFKHRLGEADLPIRVPLEVIPKFLTYTSEKGLSFVFSSERAEGITEADQPSDCLLVWLYQKSHAAIFAEPISLIQRREALITSAPEVVEALA